MPESGQDRAVDGVTVVVQGDGDHVAVWGLLDALVPQAQWCAQVIYAGGEFEQGEHPLSVKHGVSVVGVQGGTESIIDRAQAELADPAQWLWFLSAHSRPGPDTLPQLRAAVHGSSRVGIVGPKILALDEPRAVLGVGHRITVWGRSLDEADLGSWDQGQFDERRDVIGVPLEGMMIRGDVVTQIGGTDSGFDAAAGLDACWRAHLLGHRVLVAPQAVLAAPRPNEANAGERDRALIALARGSVWRLPARCVAMLVTSLLSFVLMLALRRPRAARQSWAEASAILWPGRAVRARWHFRGKAVVSERDLRGLFESESARRTALRSVHHGHTFAIAGRSAQDREELPRGRSIGAIEAGPVSEDAGSLSDEERSRTRRWWSWPLVTALLLVTATTAARWRDLGGGLVPSGWGVRGSEVDAVSAGAPDIWNAWSQPFSGAGLGDLGQGPPWLLPFSGWAWLVEQLPAGPDGLHSAGVATAWLLCASGVFSVLSAYLAARVVTGSRMIKAVLALGWAGAAPLAVGTQTGRLGPVMVHVLAPLLVAGAVRSMRRGGDGTSAAFAVGVLTALAAWFVPLSAVFALGVGIVVALAAPGWARLRAVPIVLLPLALFGPHILDLVEEPILVLGGPGATDTAAAPLGAWQALLLHPGGPISLSLWWIVPAWLLAAVGAAGLRGGRRGGAALGLSLAALTAIAAAVIAGRVTVGQLPPGYADTGLSVGLWPGTFLSLGGAALMLAAGAGAADMIRRREISTSGQGSGAAAGSVVLAVAGAAALASLGIQGSGALGTQLSAAQAPLPAVVAERAAGSDAVRMIELTPQAVETPASAGGVTYALVGREPGPWLRDRARDLVQSQRRELPADPVAAVVAALVDTTERTVADQTPLEQGLADLAVGFVLVDAPADHPLVTQMDGLPSLTRVSSTQGVGLWRVVPEAVGSRVWVASASGSRTPVPVEADGSAAATIPSDSASVAVSQSEGWSRVAQVRLDGQLLTAEPGFPIRYAVPSGGGALTIDVAAAYQRWWWATGAVALIAGFFAMPAIGAARRQGR